ncbi:hypothetical protein PVAP13_9NG073220 [Panicum virgatum]|uniref:Uncharacterized protein n=1 Tax=Panicum virgatum TaxID=38727 RepID=A0A8T0MDC2_PANVG|nr:hypothetical protein PVAP13_9NG073220 [Panicum virgatum]
MSAGYNGLSEMVVGQPMSLCFCNPLGGTPFFLLKVSEQFQNVARLQAPEFATLLTVMNNAGYGETVDDAHYDVNKVMMNLEGW